jgi:hypothetical protein
MAAWANGQNEYIQVGEGEEARLSSGLTLRLRADTAHLRWEVLGDSLRCGWFQPRREVCVIGEVERPTLPADEMLANFGQQIALTDIDFPTGALEPGQAVDITLRWQALQPIEGNYTVTVQLLGPGGVLYGQSDSWPVQGTRPTSTWEPGQPIVDRYTVNLAPDAPSGSYQVLVALYTLNTNTRLVVLNAEGLPVDNKATFPGLYVPGR